MRGTRISTIGVAVFICTLANGVRAERPDIRWVVGGHRDSVLGAAFSPDGQLVASASDDGTVKLWRVGDGVLMHTVVNPVGGSNAGRTAVAFSPDGQSISAAGTGGTDVWPVSGGGSQDAFCAETGYATTWSSDGGTLVVGGTPTGSEEVVCLFSRGNFANPRTFGFAQPHYVFSVAMTPDGGTVLAGTGRFFIPSEPGFIRYWRVSDGVEVRTLNDQGGGVRAIDLSPDGVTFASGGGNASLKIRQLSDGAIIRPLTGHTGEIYAVAYSPDGSMLASSAQDGTLRQWDPNTGQLLRTINASSTKVYAADWSSDGAHLVSGADDGSLQLWDAATGAEVRKLSQLTGAPNHMAVSADGQSFALAAGFEVQVRRTIDGSLVRSIATPTYTARVGISPDGQVIADTHGNDLNVRVRRVSDGALLFTLTGHSQIVGTVAFSPDGQWIATCSFFDASARLYRASDGQFIRSMTEAGMTPLDIVFSPASDYLATVGDGAIRFWRLSDGAVIKRIGTAHNSGVGGLAISRDGTLAATASYDSTVKLFRISDGQLLHTLTGHEGGTATVSFSPDGSVLASGGTVGELTLRLWRVSDGAPLAVYDEETGTGAICVSFVPQSGRLAFLRNDATVVQAANPFVPAVLGDIDGDGLLGASDVVAFVNVLLGNPLTPDHASAADLNKDSRSDGLDIAPFLSAMVGT